MNFLTNTVATNGSLAEVLGSVDLSGLLDGVMAVLPVSLGVVVSALAIRKGVSFLIGMIRGA